jgi:hypothetical protein
MPRFNLDGLVHIVSVEIFLDGRIETGTTGALRKGIEAIKRTAQILVNIQLAI